MSIIRATDCSFQYADGTQALHGIHLEIGEGELVFLTGESGSGKTTTTRLVLGMDCPTSGSIEVLGLRFGAASTAGGHANSGGHAMPSERAIRALRRRVGTVFQSFRLIQGRTALSNVVLPLRFADERRSDAAMKTEALEALERVGLAAKAHKLVESLSQGEAQRVAIARAIVTKPALIIADEPTGNLDPDNSIATLRLLASFAKAPCTVLVTTHAVHLIEDVPAHKKRRIELRSGRIVRDELAVEGR